MKNWTHETKQYFETLMEAKFGAEYENTTYRRFNGIGYDAECGKFYVSYVYKY